MGKALVEEAEKAEFGFPAPYTVGCSDVSGINPSTVRWDGFDGCYYLKQCAPGLKRVHVSKITERSIR